MKVDEVEDGVETRSLRSGPQIVYLRDPGVVSGGVIRPFRLTINESPYLV